jgi:protein SCO1/2
MSRAILILMLAVACWPGGAGAAAFDAFTAAGIDQKPGATVPLAGAFVDFDGRKVDLAELGRGKPILLVPVLHKCPNICGLTLSGLMDAIGGQAFHPGRDFAFVTIGIDPRETPADAAASIGELRRRYPNLDAATVHALTGDATAVMRAIGYRYAFDPAAGQYAHVAASAVLTADGHLVRWLYGVAPEPVDVHLALAEAGQGRIGGLTDRILLLCYHYDPVTGRYDAMAWTMLQVAGGGTAAGLLAFVALMLRRERTTRRGPS